MSENAGIKVIEESKTAAWRSWEGRTVNEEFRLRDYLGGSGHSAVFLTDLYDRDHHTAAIKLVPANSPMAAALLASCDLASALSHPNLLHVLTAGRAQIDGTDVAYAVMEYAEENLGQVISQRPLTRDEARDMLKPTLEALCYLHAQGLAHGRIRPANIMATGDQLKLSSDTVRRNGEPLAEPTPYDPPEGIASEAGDSWSLGMALVEILTQRLPEWNRDGSGDPEIPSGILTPLDEIVRNSLRRDPKLRWTATDIAYHLDPEAAPKRTFQAELAARTVSREPEPASAPYSPSREAAPMMGSGAKKRSLTTYLIPAVLVCAGLAGLVLWLSRGSNSKSEATSSVAESAPTPAATAAPATPPPAIVPKPNQPKAAQPKPAPSQPPHIEAVQPKPASTIENAASSTPTPETPIASAASASKPAETEPSPAPASAASESAPTEAASTPTSASESSVPRSVVHQVIPEPSQTALDTIHGSVRVSVRVDVDTAGAVKYAKLDSPGPSAYFANQALRAAQEWKFAPAGHPSQQLIHFVFTSSGVSGSTTAG